MPEQVPAIKEKIIKVLASAVEARKTATHRYVTKAMNAVEFRAPVAVVPA